jgi:hypothetical protein
MILVLVASQSCAAPLQNSAYLLGERLNAPKDGMALEVFDMKQGEWVRL